MDSIFHLLDTVEDSLWSFFGFPAMLLIGLWLTVKAKGVQITKFPVACKTFFGFLFSKREEGDEGIHPISAFFACLGGCVGIGNIVAITTAVQLGGPGAVFWMWVTAILGTLIKYSEVFLGVKHRVSDSKNGFSGGPMYYLKKAFGSRLGGFASSIFCVLMCLYGVEVFQFSVVTHAVSENFAVNNTVVTLILLMLVIFAEIGGIQRIGTICAMIIPGFIAIYLGMGFYVLVKEYTLIPQMFVDVFSHAFTAHGAVGGFAGSSLLMTMSQGIKKGCYSTDVGVGYASIMHSSSRVKSPEKQASLVIFDVFLDTFVVCTMSMFLVLVTGVWKTGQESACLVQEALSGYFPFMDLFMPFFLFLLGYSTIITYFTAGAKTAEFVGKKRGKVLYYVYAAVVLFVFSFVETAQALVLMSLVQVLLLAINLSAVIKMRKELSFDIEEEKAVCGETVKV